jgi:hypothetical protein
LGKERGYFAASLWRLSRSFMRFEANPLFLARPFCLGSSYAFRLCCLKRDGDPEKALMRRKPYARFWGA